MMSALSTTGTEVIGRRGKATLQKLAPVEGPSAAEKEGELHAASPSGQRIHRIARAMGGSRKRMRGRHARMRSGVVSMIGTRQRQLRIVQVRNTIFPSSRADCSSAPRCRATASPFHCITMVGKVPVANGAVEDHHLPPPRSLSAHHNHNSSMVQALAMAQGRQGLFSQLSAEAFEHA